jgi:hypothetical protein
MMQSYEFLMPFYAVNCPLGSRQPYRVLEQNVAGAFRI